MGSEHITSTIRAIVHRLTGRELHADDYERSFFDWGADSLTLIQLGRAIDVELGTRIEFRRFFGDLGSLAAIIAHLSAAAPRSDAAPAPLARPPAEPATTSVEATVEELSSNEQVIREIVNRQLAVMEEQLTILGRYQAARPPAARESPGQPAAVAAIPQPSAVPARPRSEERAYVPYRPADLSAATFTEAQGQYVQRLMTELVARSSGSRASAARQRRVLADPRLMTGFRPAWKDLVYPLYVAAGRGARVWDVDGHEYVDLCMGYGSYLFGHAPDFWTAALRRGESVPIGPQSEVVGRVAELVTRLTAHERAAFFNSGTEAVMAALRAARTTTGRHRVAMFAGAYHGWSDQVLAQYVRGDEHQEPSAPGVPPSAVADTLVLPYGIETSLETLEREGASLAAILVEPVQSRRPDVQPVEFLRRAREIASASGTALVFDEMITGFRCAPGGVQQLWGIPADLAIYGKAAAGGLPLGIVAGRATFMNAFDGGAWEYGDDSGPEGAMTFCAGTYFKHPLVMAGAEACLGRLEQEPGLQRDLNARVARWVEELQRRLDRQDLSVRVLSFSSWFRLRFEHPFPHSQLFYYALRMRGVFAWEGGNFFISLAHTDTDLEAVATAIEGALVELRSVGFLRAVEAQDIVAPAAPPASIEPTAPLTPAQRDVWLSIEIGHASSDAFNECIALECYGELDVAALTAAVAHLVQRHEAFRTIIDGQGPTQTFRARAVVEPSIIDLTSCPARERGERLQAALHEAVSERFSLERGPLFRLAVIRTGARTHVVAFVFHHVILDNWSIGTVLRELPRLYGEARGGPAAALQAPHSFAEFARAEADAERVAQAHAFWTEVLGGVPTPPPALPVDGTGALGEVVRCARSLPAEVVERLRAIAAEAGTTIAAATLGAFDLFLHRATGAQDLVVGMPVAGQPFAGAQTLVGYCLNVLPLRSRYAPGETFTALVRRVGAELAAALEHRTCQLSALVEQLSIADRGRGHPLIAALFNYDISGSPPVWPDLEVRSLTPPKSSAKLGLEVNLTQHSGTLEVEFAAGGGSVAGPSIERWLDVFVHLVYQLVRTPQAEVGSAQLLDDRTADLVLDWGRGPVVPRDRATVASLIGRVAVEHPDRVAVIHGSEHLTYGELHRRMRACAAFVQERGIGVGALVPICLERTVDMVPCVLGILEAGAAYVPIDPMLNRERIGWMLDDCQADGVFVDAVTIDIVRGVAPERCRLERLAEAVRCEHAFTPVSCGPENLAYVIYTSGSTGRPKGAMNAHSGVVNQLRWIQEALPLAPDDRVLQKTSLSFDASVWELLWPLSAGATLVLASRDAQWDAAALHRDIQTHRVTTAIFVPSMLREVVALPGELSPALRRIGCIGEVVTPALASEVRRRLPCADFWNFYGPTEAAVAITAERCPAGPDIDRVSIGKPIANCQVYVVDAQGQLVPPGVEGELYLAGLGVGWGYWNRPDLTADRFVPDSFGPAGTRAYRTGDRARYGADGRLDFIGRTDGQLKVRGYRIEIGEIEAVIAQYAGIGELAVWPTSREGGLELAAAWTGAATPSEVRAWLAARLPRYMLPATLGRLASLPHLPNGKLDRPALAHLRTESEDDEPSAARPDSIEGVMQRIWEDVLGRPVASGDSFVAAGGHSLQAMQVVNRIASTFGVALPVRTLFEEMALADVSARVEAAMRGRPTLPIAPVPRTGPVAASPAQERFWFLDQLFDETGACNLPLAVRISGPLDVPALQAALDAVIARHEVLRTTFELGEDGTLYQHIAPALQLTWELCDGHRSDAQRLAQLEARRPFDLSRDPVLRSALVSVGCSEWVWLLTIHHIAADAWSIQLLWRELSQLYRAVVGGAAHDLPVLPVQYADLACWQRQQIESGTLSESLAYWRRQLAEPPPPIQWKTSGTADSCEDVSIELTVDRATVAALTTLMRAQAATPSMVIVAAVEVVTSHHAGQSDFLVGVPIHGRTRKELEPLIGCFVNMLPIRAQVEPEMPFLELLAQARSRMLEAYAHADLPFEMAMVDRARGPRSVGLVVSVRNVPTYTAPIPELVCEVFEAARPASAHELLCEVAETTDGWRIVLTGSSPLFTRDLITQLSEHLSSVLVDVAADPRRAVASLSPLGSAVNP